MSIPNYSGDPNDKTDDTPFDALKESSLKAAGYAYLVGDAGLFASGMMAGRSKEAASGLLYTVGGLACAKYANPSAEKQLKLLGTRLGSYLRKEGVNIPADADLKELTKPAGALDQVEAFLYKYPSQVLNATYAVGGVQLLRSGMQHGKGWDTASGALVAAGGLAGLLISEKKPDTEHPAKTPFAKAMSWLQEKPLRISGGLYALNNVTLIMSALGERKANPANHSYMFKFLTAASYILGNGLLAMSSKDNHGSDTHGSEALDKLASAAARIIAAQPAEVREPLLQHVAGFLAAQPEVDRKAEDITKLMHEKMQQVQSVGSPGSWLSRVPAWTPGTPVPGV